MRLILACSAFLVVQAGVLRAQLPAPWRPYGDDSASYKIGIDSVIAYSGHRSLRIAAPPDASNDMWAAVTQVVEPAPFRGHRVRLSAAGRTENAGLAGIWFRVEGPVDGAPALVGFDNMLDRAITGTTDWHVYEVVLDVPADATVVAFGSLLVGGGEFWVDQFRVEAVPNSVPVTNQLSEPETDFSTDVMARLRSVSTPTNLGFE